MRYWPLLLLLATRSQDSVRAQNAPNTKACCAAAGVSTFCTDEFCNVATVPDYFTIFKLTSKCPKYLTAIAGCLSNGRNHEPCCRANSRDHLTCLHLCNGTAPSVNTTLWGDNYTRYRHGSEYGTYVSCLSFNLQAMFTCIKSGYNTSPDSPSQVSVRLATQTTAEVSWNPPEKLASEVKDYIVYYQKSAGFTKTTETARTTNTRLALSDLSPDTKYEVHIVATAKTGSATSLPSDSTVFITKGVAPKAKPYVEDVLAAEKSVVTLVCKVEVHGSQHISDINLKWLKFSEGRYRTLDYSIQSGPKPKYSNYSYPRRISVDSRNVFLMTLTLHNFETNDIGSYKCQARNSFGYDSAVISVRQAPVPAPPEKPQNVTACCIQENKRYDCPSLCSREQTTELTNFKCAIAQINIMLKCSTEGLDYKPCCLRERVPDRCLPFCDGRMGFSSDVNVFQCMPHSTNIMSCHQEALEGFPNPPSNVKLTATTKDSMLVTWNEVVSAERYVVYYRRTGSSQAWLHATSPTTQVKLRNLRRNGRYDILVLAANRAGFSDNSTPMYIDLRQNRAFYARI